MAGVVEAVRLGSNFLATSVDVLLCVRVMHQVPESKTETGHNIITSSGPVWGLRVFSQSGTKLV